MSKTFMDKCVSMDEECGFNTAKVTVYYVRNTYMCVDEEYRRFTGHLGKIQFMDVERRDGCVVREYMPLSDPSESIVLLDRSGVPGYRYGKRDTEEAVRMFTEMYPGRIQGMVDKLIGMKCASSYDVPE